MKKAKGKGIATAPAAVVDRAAGLFPVPEDPWIRFRHQGLLQDYRDLLKETDAMRKKMEILKQRKLTLLAEVQFLRYRYRYFVDNQISKSPQSRHNVKPKNSGIKSKTTKRKDPVTKAPVSGSNVNKKQKTSIVKRRALPPANMKEEKNISQKNEVVRYSSSISMDLNQRDLLGSGREVALLNSQPAYELPQKQMLYREADATTRNPAPIFDLNQISAEESQTSNDQQRIEAAYKISGGGGIEEHRNQIDLVVYRNRTNMKGLNNVGKRRISWQDQVALKVEFWICVLLTVLGYIPGIIYALYAIVFVNRDEFSMSTGAHSMFREGL